MIALEETRSIVALAAGILIFACALTSIFVMAENYNGTYEYPLHYFTVWSNILSAVAAAFMIPYAVGGIRAKRFILPRWIVLFQYAGANCLAITLVAALTIILPTQGLDAVSGTNFWLHIITPALTIILFQCVETGFVRRDRGNCICDRSCCACSYRVSHHLRNFCRDRMVWKAVKEEADNLGIRISEKEFLCAAFWIFINKGLPSDADHARAKEFAKSMI